MRRLVRKRWVARNGLPSLPVVSAQRQGVVAAVADLMILCQERDLAFPLELAADLAVQRLLVPLNGQKEVGAQLLELPKNGI